MIFKLRMNCKKTHESIDRVYQIAMKESIEMQISQKQSIDLRLVQAQSKGNPPRSSLSSQDILRSEISWKTQMVRLVSIPILIVLLLLVITLAFEKPAYEYNDYFYSKNIQINRKIRGVVPPLNQSKSQIYGQFQIGLIQTANRQNRTKFKDFKAFLHRTNDLVIETAIAGCESLVYRLKFYSNMVFIQKYSDSVKNLITHQKNSGSSTKSSQQSITDQNQSERHVSSGNCENSDVQELEKYLTRSRIWNFSEKNLYFMSLTHSSSQGENVVLILERLSEQKQS